MPYRILAKYLNLILSKIRQESLETKRSAKQMMYLLGPTPNLHQSPFNLECGEKACSLPSLSPHESRLSAKRLSSARPSPNTRLSLPFRKARLPLRICSKGAVTLARRISDAH